jgi:hypothetical protein
MYIVIQFVPNHLGTVVQVAIANTLNLRVAILWTIFERWMFTCRTLVSPVFLGKGKYFMKSVISIRPVICGLIMSFALNAQNALTTSHLNSESAASAASSAVLLNQPTRGVVFKTAAINSDGTLASCFRCSSGSTLRLGTGAYQVAFDENVQAINGWSRFVQVDTLSTGSVNAWCTTADRLLVPNAIYVSCQAPGGPGSQGNSKAVDVSFFMFVAR